MKLEDYKKLKDIKCALQDMLDGDDELSPLLYESNTTINHKALCPYCKLPLDIRELVEYKLIKKPGQGIRKPGFKRESLVVSCIKNKYRRIEMPEAVAVPLGEGWLEASNNLPEMTSFEQIASCGDVRHFIPLTGSNIFFSHDLIHYPKEFSNKLRAIIGHYKEEHAT